MPFIFRITAATLFGFVSLQACAAAQVVTGWQSGYTGPSNSYDKALSSLAFRATQDVYSSRCVTQADADCDNSVQFETPLLLGFAKIALPTGNTPPSFVTPLRRIAAPAQAGSLSFSEIVSVSLLIFSFCLVGASLRRPSAKLA